MSINIDMGLVHFFVEGIGWLVVGAATVWIALTGFCFLLGWMTRKLWP